MHFIIASDDPLAFSNKNLDLLSLPNTLQIVAAYSKWKLCKSHIIFLITPIFYCYISCSVLPSCLFESNRVKLLSSITSPPFRFPILIRSPKWKVLKYPTALEI